MAEDKVIVEKWGVFEASFAGPSAGNPFVEVEFSASFEHGGKVFEADGFYDGGGVYKLRFMPGAEGRWRFRTKSGAAALDGREGSFLCAAPSPGNHGPVRVRDGFHFAYADGAPYHPVGTTCYAWVHQGEALEESTLKTLAASPFNKLRMCVFPKHYDFNSNEPEFYPYEGSLAAGWDFRRFQPRFFAHLEKRILDLQALGIEADLILFHEYDRWGFAHMPPDCDDLYVRYLCARLSAFRNVWWSLANEYDLMKSKTAEDWDRFFRILRDRDAAGHLRSIHNCRAFYDHARPWVTHCSIQSSYPERAGEWQKQYGKPVVLDECCYEGDIPNDWGNITAQELVHRHWLAYAWGGYAGHGETYWRADEVLWWAKGGELYGQSPARLAFLRRVMEEAGYAEPVFVGKHTKAAVARDGVIIAYYGRSQPRYKDMELPPGRYRAELLDTWEMTVEKLEGTYEGACRVTLPGRPYLALRLIRI